MSGCPRFASGGQVVRALLVATSAAWALSSAAQDHPENTVRFQSEASTPFGASLDLLKLYTSLDQRGLLPLRPYPIREGDQVADVMRDQRLWFHEDFPEELDVLLCRKNRPVCSVGSGETTGTGHLARWTLRAGVDVLLPDMDLEAYPAPQLYRKQASESLNDIVVNKTRGCHAFDDWCQKYILALNHRADDVMSSGYEGNVLVPSLAIQGSFRLAPPPAVYRPGFAPPVHRSEESGAESHATSARPRPMAAHAPERGAREILAEAPDLDRQLIPRVSVKMEAADDPLKIQQHDLFALIHHPFARGANIDGGAEMTIAVIDGWVDDRHCNFGPAFAFRNRASRDLPRKVCRNKTIESPQTALDHGTHVAGIIAARDDGNGIVGVYPRGHVVTFEANYQNELYADEVGRFIEAPVVHAGEPPEQIDIFNISATYKPDQVPAPGEAIEARVKKLADAKLVVAAAGNEPGVEMSTGCRVWPACFRSRNLLSVVALDSDPDSPDVLADEAHQYLSNYGTVFDVGAPGQAILSTIHGDRWGFMSGTSQATPVVSGAAAILWGTDQRLRPAHVKERLIATSDLVPSLRGKVLGGRINLDRALDYRRDQLEIVQDGETKKLSGRLDYQELQTEGGQALGAQMLYWGDAEDERIQVRHVLRLHRDDSGPGNATWTMLVRDWRTALDNRDGAPIRYDGIRLLPTSSKPLRLRVGNTDVEFQAPQVVEFVARLTEGFWDPQN